MHFYRWDTFVTFKKVADNNRTTSYITLDCFNYLSITNYLKAEVITLKCRKIISRLARSIIQALCNYTLIIVNF